VHRSSQQPFTSRVDLHVHTKYSDRPSEWILRRIGAPESFVEPHVVYERAKAHGMSFVTISDHNKIDGALDIAHLPDTFISSEITTYFPENGAKMHVLVTGITEDQFARIQDVRTDIRAFRQLLVEEDIIYSVAHPLFLVNDRLTVSQFEELLVLFNRFEAINGTRDHRAGDLVRAILEGLTPEHIDALADRYDVEPIGEQPHKKMMTGGSDDHSGLYVGSAHTVTPQARTVEEFLGHLRAGKHEPGGTHGNSVHLAHCFYSIAYAYYKDRILRDSNQSGSLLGEMLRRLLEPRVEPAKTSRGVRGIVSDWVWRRRRERMSDAEQLLVQEFSQLASSQDNPLVRRPGQTASATDAFEISCRLSHQLGYAFLQRFMQKVSSGDLIKSLEAVAALGPVAAAIAPYLAAFKTQHKDEAFIQQVAQHFGRTDDLRWRSKRRGWVTDTFDDVNGVARTIRTLAGQAHAQDRPLEVMTCLDTQPDVRFACRNFKPIGMFSLPEYPAQKIAFPPFLEVIEHIERRKFAELIISTPGPLGLAALAAAKMMNLRTVGIYHTDFPKFIRILTEDAGLESVTWRYMSWFFQQCDVILAPSEYYRNMLIEHGFTPGKIRILRRGVSPHEFSPKRRRGDFWMQFQGREAFTFLYCGRVSAEKNIEVLTDAFTQLRETHPDAQLAIVGDGPLLDTLRRRYRDDANVVFTGFLRGNDLAEAYASADAFIFPSTTDTFGNAVLEAQASGLPAVVSDRGGPQEIVGINDSGVVLDLSAPMLAVPRLAETMTRLIDDADWRDELRARGLRTAQQMRWSAVFDDLWYAATPDDRPQGVIDSATTDARELTTDAMIG
jgi:glycosyltransferase involved in cell wall biosynthesis/predicted metal-dependent phosphoesterase TrpH